MMNAKRMHFLLLGLLILSIVGLFAGAYVINSLLAKQATKLADLKQQVQTLEGQQTGLKKAKNDIAKYGELSKITKQVVPQDKDQAQTVRELVNIASAAGVKITTISFPASTLGAGVAATAASGAATATTPSAAVSTKTLLSQLIAVPNIPGVYQLQITIQNDADTEVSYNQLYRFLSALENNRRTAQVSNIVISPDAQNRNSLQFTLSLSEYIKPS
ncbi:MAG TPA: hypothetical protein VFI84_00060 [Candidatus Saccharimonadales bacterium]|nr:hypothetical protein [Candidatus Saccharimonadales bacterium]